MKAVQLKEVPVGEIGIWKHKVSGDVYFEVIRQAPQLGQTFVIDDLSQTFWWNDQMEVWITD